MSPRATSVTSFQSTDSAVSRRSDNLSLAYQEIFTAVVRLRANRQAVTDADAFRAQFQQALKMAEQEALRRHYTGEDVRMATFAVVAFLDESVLSCRNPALANWPRLPLQEQMFGDHMAGETFYKNLHQILTRHESSETADLLGVYELCLLLGYRGRYGAGGSAEVRAIIDRIEDKIRRINGPRPALSPPSVITTEAVPRGKRDRWIRGLAVTSVALLVITAVLFGVFQYSLVSRVRELPLLTQGR